MTIDVSLIGIVFFQFSLRTPKNPDPSVIIGLRVPIPSEKTRNVGGPIPSLGHTNGFLGNNDNTIFLGERIAQVLQLCL